MARMMAACVLLYASGGWFDLAPVEGQTQGRVSAGTEPGYDLDWSSVDGGGWTYSSGGAYSLGGTIGQHDAGLLLGGEYALVGGFWGGGAPAPRYTNHLPLVLRDS